jgi:hypothetical protein
MSRKTVRTDRIISTVQVTYIIHFIPSVYTITAAVPEVIIRATVTHVMIMIDAVRLFSQAERSTIITRKAIIPTVATDILIVTMNFVQGRCRFTTADTLARTYKIT